MRIDLAYFSIELLIKNLRKGTKIRGSSGTRGYHGYHGCYLCET